MLVTNVDADPLGLPSTVCDECLGGELGKVSRQYLMDLALVVITRH